MQKHMNKIKPVIRRLFWEPEGMLGPGIGFLCTGLLIALTSFLFLLPCMEAAGCMLVLALLNFWYLYRKGRQCKGFQDLVLIITGGAILALAIVLMFKGLDTKFLGQYRARETAVYLWGLVMLGPVCAYFFREKCNSIPYQATFAMLWICFCLTIALSLLFEEIHASFLEKVPASLEGLFLGTFISILVLTTYLLKKRCTLPLSAKALLVTSISLNLIIISGVSLWLINLNLWGNLRVVPNGDDNSLLSGWLLAGGAGCILPWLFYRKYYRQNEPWSNILGFLCIGLCSTPVFVILFVVIARAFWGADCQTFADGDCVTAAATAGIGFSALWTISVIVFYTGRNGKSVFSSLKARFPLAPLKKDIVFRKEMVFELREFLLGVVCGMVLFCYPVAAVFLVDSGAKGVFSELAYSGLYEIDAGRFAHIVLKDSYLWKEHVEPLTVFQWFQKDARPPNEVLEALRYAKRDKWSYAVEAKEHSAYYLGGLYTGLGVRFKREKRTNIVVDRVYENSPAGRAGIQRGLKVLSIGGYDTAQIIKENLWSAIFSVIKKPIKFVFEDLEGSIVEKEIQKGVVVIKPAFSRCLDFNGKRIGYLYVDCFIGPLHKELDAVFKGFKQEGIDELIMDLRYNGGGGLQIASYLAGLVSRNRTKDRIFASLKYNEDDSYRNRTIYFDSNARFSLDLKRVVVITSASTASASEWLINGLRPFVEVIQIGRTTHGKPVGMDVVYFGGYVICAINFKGYNADGKGDFFGGIEPTCMAEDDLTHQLGDPGEGCVKEALYYLEHGRCRPKIGTRGRDETSLQRTEPVPLEGLFMEIGAF